MLLANIHYDKNQPKFPRFNLELILSLYTYTQKKLFHSNNDIWLINKYLLEAIGLRRLKEKSKALY